MKLKHLILLSVICCSQSVFGQKANQQPLIIICVSCRPKKKTEPEKKAVTGATYTNPLRERGAEPWAVFHEGKYYYTQGSESRIMLWETSDIQI